MCARMWVCVLLCVSVDECKYVFVTPCVKIQSVPTDSSGVGGAVSVGTERLSAFLRMQTIDVVILYGC